MTRINLLPASYTTADAARVRHQRYVLWGVVLLAAAACWWQAATLQARRLSHLADQEEHRLQAARAQAAVLSGMDKRRREGQAVLAMQDDLQEPIHTTAIIAALSHALPPTVALTRLSVEMTPPRVPAVAAQAPASGAAGRPQTTAKPPERQPIRIELDGMAKTEHELARCVSALSSHRLFTNVKLAKSRQEIDGHADRFGFTITADIPVNRTYIVKKEATANAI